MRPPTDLPLKETGFSRIQSYPRHRCDLVAEGFAIEGGKRHYDYDNRTRRNGCLFQYTFSGEGRFQAFPGNRTMVLKRGMGILLPFPSPTRYWLAPGTDWEFCYIILDGDMAVDLVHQLTRQYGYLWEIPPAHAAIDLIRRVHRRVLEGRIPDEFEAASMGYRFLMELFHFKRSPGREVSAPIERVVKLMERDYREATLDMDRIAAEAGYSRFHFSRLFRREMGTSPCAYLQQFRLQRALELITTTDLPIKQIAFDCGYHDYAYFCREFKRRTRRTPGTVRRLGDQLNLSVIHTR